MSTEHMTAFVSRSLPCPACSMSWWLKISQCAVLLSMSIFVKERGVLLKVVSLSVTNLVRQLHFLLKDFFYLHM